MLLTIPFAFCLFHKIMISYITKYMTEPPTAMMNRLETVIKCIARYMINDCNSVTLEGNGNPLQYSCLENPMDRGAW